MVSPIYPSISISAAAVTGIRKLHERQKSNTNNPAILRDWCVKHGIIITYYTINCWQVYRFGIFDHAWPSPFFPGSGVAILHRLSYTDPRADQQERKR